MLYLIIILACSLLIILANSLPSLSPEILLNNTIAVSIGVIVTVAIDGLSALAIRRLFPKAWFAPDAKAFHVSKKEHLFYNKFAIKRWKDKVPELGMFTGFDKGRVESISKSTILSAFYLRQISVSPSIWQTAFSDF